MGCAWSAFRRDGREPQPVDPNAPQPHFTIGNANFGPNYGNFNQVYFFQGHGEGSVPPLASTTTGSDQVGTYCHIPTYVPTAPAWSEPKRTTEGYGLEPLPSSQVRLGEADPADRSSPLHAGDRGTDVSQEEWPTQHDARSHPCNEGYDKGSTAEPEPQSPSPRGTRRDALETLVNLNNSATGIIERSARTSQHESSTITQLELKESENSAESVRSTRRSDTGTPNKKAGHSLSRDSQRTSYDIEITARVPLNINDQSQAPDANTDSPQSVPEPSPPKELVQDANGPEKLRKKEVKRVAKQEAEKARRKHAEQMYLRTHLYAD